jgi:hypothetical protein
MKTGKIILKNLYEHMSSDPLGESLKGSSPVGRNYGKLATNVVQSIPESHGFYLWGYYEKNKLWRSLYLGKAGYGKTTSLRARIKEELKDERVFLWYGPHSTLTEENLKSINEKYYPTMWYQYKNHFARAIKKSKTTHIIWVVTSDLDNSEVIKIEADLIETMNPSANIMRPGPTSGLQDKTIEIIRMFKNQIHLGRNDWCM